ncbi:MAG TPA: hypothetical protein VE959_37600 [Bryobacteraceae bacterium]|nr:hypothetical protein [Bryobacteraceae bacterium]
MDEELRGLLVERINQVCQELAEKGSFLIDDAANQVIAELRAQNPRNWTQIRDHFAVRGVTRYIHKVVEQAKAADPAQATLPGLESMPLLVTSEGAAILSQQLIYDAYQTEWKRLERKINSYKYKRRKPENLEHDIQRLAEMKQFDPRFAQYSEKDPDIPLWKAKEMELKELSAQSNGPVRQRKRKK